MFTGLPLGLKSVGNRGNTGTSSSSDFFGGLWLLLDL